MKRAASASTTIPRHVSLALLIALSTNFAADSWATSANQSPRSLTPLQLEIEKLRQRLGSSEAEERREALMRLGALHRAEASREALPALSDPVPIVRATAANALLSVPGDEAVPALVPLLKDQDEFVRREAAYALGQTRSRGAVPPLLERLTTDKSEGVQAAAAVALGMIGDESAIVVLAQVLGPGSSSRTTRKRKPKGNEFVLTAAARSLGQIGSRAGLPALIDALSNDAQPNNVRREAARALGSIGDPSAVPALRVALTAPDPYLSQIAYDALRKISKRGEERF